MGSMCGFRGLTVVLVALCALGATASADEAPLPLPPTAPAPAAPGLTFDFPILAPSPLPLDFPPPVAAIEPRDVVAADALLAPQDPPATDAAPTPADAATAGRWTRSACCPPRCDPCDPCSFPSPWTIGLYVTGTQFEDPEGLLGEPLPVGAGPGTPFDWGLNSFDPALGGRLRIVHRRGCRDSFELRGTYYGKVDDSSIQTGQFAFANGPGVSPVATATLENMTYAWSADINYWRVLSDKRRWTTSIGAGWRYLHIHERATAKDWVGLAPSAFLESDVHNSFMAAQLMVGAAFHATRRIDLMADVKVMGGAMTSDITIDEDSILSGGTKQSEKGSTEFAWGVEATFEGRIRLGRSVYVRGGYELLFIDGIQGATDSMDFGQAATGAVQPRLLSSTRVMHSVFLGLDIDV